MSTPIDQLAAVGRVFLCLSVSSNRGIEMTDGENQKKKQFCSRKELCDALCLSYSTAQRLEREGTIRAAYRLGRTARYNLADNLARVLARGDQR